MLRETLVLREISLMPTSFWRNSLIVWERLTSINFDSLNYRGSFLASSLNGRIGGVKGRRFRNLLLIKAYLQFISRFHGFKMLNRDSVCILLESGLQKTTGLAVD